MKIIISPAKKMKEGVDFADAVSLPRYLDKTQQLLDHLKALNHDELKQLLACSDAITLQNEMRFATMDLKMNTMPALLAYQGTASPIQAVMAPATSRSSVVTGSPLRL